MNCIITSLNNNKIMIFSHSIFQSTLTMTFQFTFEKLITNISVKENQFNTGNFYFHRNKIGKITTINTILSE